MRKLELRQQCSSATRFLTLPGEHGGTVRQADATTNLALRRAAVFDRFGAAYVLVLVTHGAIKHVLDEAYRLLCRDGKLCIVNLTEGITPVSRLVISAWKCIYAFKSPLAGRLQTLAHINPARSGQLANRARGGCFFMGTCSEIVIASPA